MIIKLELQMQAKVVVKNNWLFRLNKNRYL